MSKSIQEKREIAKSEAQDKMFKIIAGLLPYGSPAYELITTIIVPLHEKKKREFINDLADRLKKLEEEGKINYSELAESNEFNTIITKAILLAQQNHQIDKIESFKNLVQNTAIKVNESTLETDVTEHYLRLIDRLNDIHILILDTFRSPEGIKESGIRESEVALGHINSSMVFFKIHPSLKSRRDYIEVVWNELYSQGLLIKENIGHSIAVEDSIKPLVSDFGQGLLAMIEEPK